MANTTQQKGGNQNQSTMDKAKDIEVTGIVKFALVAIVTLVLTYVAMRVVPPETVPDLLRTALGALKTA